MVLCGGREQGLCPTSDPRAWCSSARPGGPEASPCEPAGVAQMRAPRRFAEGSGAGGLPHGGPKCIGSGPRTLPSSRARAGLVSERLFSFRLLLGSFRHIFSGLDEMELKEALHSDLGHVATVLTSGGAARGSTLSRSPQRQAPLHRAFARDLPCLPQGLRS